MDEMLFKLPNPRDKDVLSFLEREIDKCLSLKSRFETDFGDSNGLKDSGNKTQPSSLRSKRQRSMDNFRKRAHLMNRLIFKVNKAMDTFHSLLPNYRYALALLGFPNAAHAMLKIPASIALSNNTKKYEASNRKRARKFDKYPAVVLRGNFETKIVAVLSRGEEHPSMESALRAGGGVAGGMADPHSLWLQTGGYGDDALLGLLRRGRGRDAASADEPEPAILHRIEQIYPLERRQQLNELCLKHIDFDKAFPGLVQLQAFMRAARRPLHPPYLP